MNNESNEFWSDQWQQFIELVRLWIAHEQTRGHRMSCESLKLLEQASARKHPTSLKELVVAVQSFLSLVKGVVEQCECHAGQGDSAKAASGDTTQIEQKLQESLEETFPASDPPSWTGSHV